MSELPPEAVEKAAKAIWDATGHNPGDWVYMAPETERPQRYKAYAAAALSAAAPFIAAQALRDAADLLDLPGSSATGYYSSNNDAGYREAETHAERYLRHRADRIEGK